MHTRRAEVGTKNMTQHQPNAFAPRCCVISWNNDRYERVSARPIHLAAEKDLPSLRNPGRMNSSATQLGPLRFFHTVLMILLLKEGQVSVGQLPNHYSRSVLLFLRSNCHSFVSNPSRAFLVAGNSQ
jgi:hypothetical protein